MTLTRRLTLAALSAVSVTLAACGGSGGDFFAGGGVTGTGITFGSVTGFGSIIANERVHETTAVTQFVRNGDDTAIQDDFRVGDVVLIEWESDDGGITREATRVSYQRELFGEVTSDPDEASGTVGVLGQTVRADATTIFDDFDPVPAGAIFPPDLVQGVCVEVTGFRDASGGLFATRIELEGSCATVEIQGIIDSVAGSTIVVSGTTVDVSSATITPPGTTLQAGQSVKVKGSFTANVLNATEVEVGDDDLSGLEDDDVDIEGLISNFSGTDPNASFTVSSTIPVITNSETDYPNGSFADLGNGVRVKVEGTFSGGVLVADEVEFKLDGSVKLEAIVVAPPAAGVVTVSFGGETLTVLTDPLITQFKDETGSVPSVDDLDFGDYVKITGYVDSTVLTDAVATKLELEERTSSDANRVLQGPVDSISNPDIVILGIEVNTSSLDDADFDPFGRSNFFSQVGPGDIVEAQGTDLGGAMFWEEVELEN